MSHLQYHNYKGYGETAAKDYSYSQAVRIGDRIECSGQGGWDPETAEIPEDVFEQIDQAFKTVEHTLKNAGSKGWEQVYRMTSYHTELNDEVLHRMVANLKKYAPSHQPLWTCVGVNKLAFERMKVEIEVVAHVPSANPQEQ